MTNVDVAEVTETETGFNRDHAEALGIQFPRFNAAGPEGTSPFLAEYRLGGAAVSWSGDSLVEVLVAIEDWHRHRVSMGVVAAPLKIATAGTAGPGGVTP